MKPLCSFCCLLCYLLLIPCLALSQDQKYWIFFTDKDTIQYDYRHHLSDNAIERRLEQNIPLRQWTDIPLNSNYIEILENHKIKILKKSKWLNAVTSVLTFEQINELKRFNFVKDVIPMNNFFKILQSSSFVSNYALAIEQMEADEMTKAGLDGIDILIGVIDAGYVGASQNEYLQHLFDEKRILGVKDLVNPSRTEHFKYAETSSDTHGNTVLQMISGYEKGGSQYGFATKSKFYLARTDHGDKEFRGEEDYWITAMEWLDSLGVRIINTSLGYALGFDNPTENYKPEQMDGKTSVISQATKIATNEKGLLLVVSAGNEGNDSNWQIVSTPADSETVLSIGAVQTNGLKAGYSSIGPEFLPYLKPNVVCFSPNGTSFSAPVITGFAACLMQKKRKATNKEIFNIIEKSGHLYPYGNNYVGYGIPKTSKALAFMDNQSKNEEIEKPIISRLKYELKVQNLNEKIQLFHKKNATFVIKQELISPSNTIYTIKRPEKTLQTTVVANGKVTEIIWEGETLKQMKKAQRKAKKAQKKQQRKAKNN
jgi:hypothetical protein